jgi:hypothetical protein
VPFRCRPFLACKPSQPLQAAARTAWALQGPRGRAQAKGARGQARQMLRQSVARRNGLRRCRVRAPSRPLRRHARAGVVREAQPQGGAAGHPAPRRTPRTAPPPSGGRARPRSSCCAAQPAGRRPESALPPSVRRAPRRGIRSARARVQSRAAPRDFLSAELRAAPREPRASAARIARAGPRTLNTGTDRAAAAAARQGDGRARAECRKNVRLACPHLTSGTSLAPAAPAAPMAPAAPAAAGAQRHPRHPQRARLCLSSTHCLIGRNGTAGDGRAAVRPVPQTLPNPACPGLPWVGPGSPCVGPVLPLCCAPWAAQGHSWVSLGHSCVAPVLQHHVFPVFSAKAPDTFVVAAATT